MDADPDTPATPADRERVTAVLREHLASGRLPLADYRARLDGIRRAVTVGELAAVLEGLAAGGDDKDTPRGAGPAGSPVHGPSGAAPGPSGPAPSGPRFPSGTLNRVWLVVMTLGVVTWALVYYLR